MCWRTSVKQYDRRSVQPDADTRALGAMLARRRQVSGILVAEKNRLAPLQKSAPA